MKLRKTCAVMVMLAVLGPLASAPAMATGSSGDAKSWSSWYRWLVSLFNGGHRGGHHGGGSTTNLPGPGALGLVMVGLAATIVISRRRK